MSDLSGMSPELTDLLRGLLGVKGGASGPPAGPSSGPGNPADAPTDPPNQNPSNNGSGQAPHIYRQRIYHLIPYGHFEEVLDLCEQLNAIARSRGGTGGTLWIPTVGAQNELIVEFEFSDLATFEQGRAARNQDPVWTALIRKIGESVVPGSVRTELVETAPHLATGDP